MKSLVYIASIAFLGSVAAQGYGIRRHQKHYRPSHRSPHKSPDEPHRGSHGLPHRPHHGQPLSAYDSESEDERAPWDHSGEDDRYRPPFWDSDDDKSGPASWDREEDSDSYGLEEFFNYSDWYHYFHRKRPPKRPPKRITTTKRPRRKSTTTPFQITPHTNRPPRTKSTATTPNHTENPQPTPINTWSLTTPTPEPTTARFKHCITSKPMRTVGPTPRSTESTDSITITRTPWHLNTPTEATTHWDTTTSSPEPTTNTDEEEIPTLSPEVEDCIEKCISTPEYNPVCGTNDETYDNEGKLFCAKSCGVDVTLRRRSVCPPPIFDGDDGEGFPPFTPPPTTATSPSMGRTTPFSSFQRCMKQCQITPSFAPVCGTDLVTYMNKDRLECAKSCGEDVEILCEKPCAACGVHPVTVTPKTTTFAPPTTANVGRSTLEPDIKDCISACPMTPEYNPVCGSDHVTYKNPGHLLCSQLCGVDVSVIRLSPCSLTTSSTTTTEPFSSTLSPGVLDCIRRCPVTAEYRPVCGTDDLTYNNLGHLHCARYCGIDVEMKLETPCLDDFGTPSKSTPSPTTANINGNKDEATTKTTTKLTTPSTIEVTTPSTTQASTPSTTQETTPVSTLTTISHPILTTTIGFTIPPDILNSIFGHTTTKAPTKIKTTTTDSDDDVDLDARFGNPTQSSINHSKIIFPE